MATKPGGTALGQLGGLARRAPSVVLCALATHAIVYRSVGPSDGAHGYLGWYAPLVATLSGLSIAGLPLVGVSALLRGRESALARTCVALLPRCRWGALTDAGVLAGGSFAFVVGQESLERSLQVHHAATPSFSPASWSILVAGIVCLSYVLTWVSRVLSAVVDGLRRASATVPRPAPARWPPRAQSAARRRQSPLAVHGALRAPPAAA